MELPFPNGLPLPAPAFPPHASTISGGTQATIQLPTAPAYYAQKSPSLQPPVPDPVANLPQPACLQQNQQQQQQQGHPYHHPHNQTHTPSPYAASSTSQNPSGTWTSSERDFEHYSYQQVSPASGPVPSNYNPSAAPPRSWAAPTSHSPSYHSDEDPVQAPQQQFQSLRLSIPSTDLYEQLPLPVVRSVGLPGPNYPYFDSRRRQYSPSPSIMTDPHSAAMSPPSMGITLPSMSMSRSGFVASPDENPYSPNSDAEFATAWTPRGGMSRAGTPDSARKFSTEPYAKLIYRALMSRPSHCMSLQEIYQWFKDNTDKTNGPGKGWQNSIRHNLSMNGAFTKRPDRRLNADSPDVSANASATDGANSTRSGRDNTEWYLEEWAVLDGVQSTTRYRQKNASRRARTTGRYPISHHNSRRQYHGVPSAVRCNHPYQQQALPYARGPKIPSPARPGAAVSSMTMHEMTPPAEAVDGIPAMNPVNARVEQARPAAFEVRTPITPPDGIQEMEFWNQPPNGYPEYQYGLNDVSGVYHGDPLFEDL